MIDVILGSLAAALLVGLIGLTSVDVISRYWFNAPVDGAFELTQLLLAALIFVSLPMTTAAGEHVEVDLLSGLAGKGAQWFFNILGQSISAIVLFALSWRLWAHGGKLFHDVAVTNSLDLPLYPIAYLAAASCLISGFICITGIRKKG